MFLFKILIFKTMVLCWSPKRTINTIACIKDLFEIAEAFLNDFGEFGIKKNIQKTVNL